MKSHQISAFFLLMTVLLSSTLADEWLHVFCEAAALQEPTTHRQSRLAASPARPVAPEREKVDGLITGGRPKNGAASTERAGAKAAKQCCLTYYPGRLRMDQIDRYLETRGVCPKPGIIFHTKKGIKVCVDPRARWVQEVKQKLDQGPINLL